MREIVFPNTLPRCTVPHSLSHSIALSLAHYYMPLRFYRFYPFYWQKPFFSLTIIIIAFPYLLKTFERFFSLHAPYDANSLLYIHIRIICIYIYIYIAVTIIIIIISRSSSSSSSQLYYIIIIIITVVDAGKRLIAFHGEAVRRGG